MLPISAEMLTFYPMFRLPCGGLWCTLVVDYDAGVEDDDGPNNNPEAKAAYPFPFRSADAWHMVHRQPAELDLSRLLSKGSCQ